MANLIVPITYSDIYKEKGGTPDAFLQRLPRKQVIRILVQLLQQEDYTLEQFCEQWQLSLSYDVLVQYNIFKHNVARRDNAKVILCSIHAILELLRVAYSLPVHEPTEEYCDIDMALIFQAILAVNEIQQMDDGQFAILDELPESLSMAYMLCMTLLPYHDFTNSDLNARFMVLAYKTKRFSEFCMSNTRYAELAGRVLKTYHCTTFLDYMCVVMKLFFLSSKGCVVRLDKKDVHYNEDLTKLLELAIDVDDVVDRDQNVDYVLFRDRPLLRFEDDAFIVINRCMCVEKLYNSLIFKLKQCNDEGGVKVIKDFFQSYTTEFSERYLFYGVMQTMLSAVKYIKLSGEQCKSSCKVDGEPDFYVRNGKHVFLFEFKDVMLNKEVKVSQRYDDIKRVLENKFVHKSESDKKAAVEQLAHNIKRVLNGVCDWDDRLDCDKVIIYPILVVGDARFATVGVSEILNTYFNDTLHGAGISLSQRQRVNNLAVVSLDTLILCQYDFADKGLKLGSVLDAYYAFMKKQSLCNVYYGNVEQRFFSLSDYIERKCRLRRSGENLRGVREWLAQQAR